MSIKDVNMLNFFFQSDSNESASDSSVDPIPQTKKVNIMKSTF